METTGTRSPGAEQRAEAMVGPSADELFSLLWDALADILGTAAAATLLRRSVQRAAPRWPELLALTISRERLDYRCAVPPAWTSHAPGPPVALGALVSELWPLLVDLTGLVVVHRLEQIQALRDAGIVPPRKEDA